MSIAKELEERGFINQASAPIEEVIEGPKRVVYHGIDPTADSAHAGNFVIWMLLRHLAQDGHKIVFLVGGGTGMIGDPKTDVERPTIDPDEVAANVEKLKTQAEKIFAGFPVEFVNNADWLTKLNLLDFLRDIGKRFTINELIKKEAIAARLTSENGISYTEFAYPLLQAYDYLTLQKERGCDLQVGGSDQWGNIVAGVDLVRRIESKTVYGLTVPLIVDKATGKKFGKSEGNAVWLDGAKTSPYQFYQFWFNVTDDNVVDYLKLFTLTPLDEIENIRQAFELNPGSRDAQKVLAHEVTKLVHGEAAALAAAQVSGVLFSDTAVSALNQDEVEILKDNAPTCSVKAGDTIIDVLVNSGLTSSKREARTFVESGAVSLNKIKIADVEMLMEIGQFNNGVAVLQRGKKSLCVLQLG